jgi:hypothetical protein
MIRSIEKLKVRIDQNLNRAEKSEALSEEVLKVENKVTSLKQVRRKDSNLILHILMCPSTSLGLSEHHQKDIGECFHKGK